MPDIFDTITIPKKDIFDRISLPHKKDIFDTLGTPIPQPLPEPTRQEQLAKESNDYGFNLLTGTASEAGKEAYNLAKKTFSPFDIRNATDPIAEVLYRGVISGKPPIQAYKDMGKGVARAGYDTLQGLSHAVGDPLGTTDIASGDLTFPTARQAWRERPYESAVGVSPILAPLLMKGISAIPRRQPEIKISPEAKQAYTSGIQEIGQTLKNIPDQARPAQARVVADLRNQMRSALFKDDVATINSIVADFREGQTIPTAQQPKPTLNIPEINATTLREKQAKALARQKNVIQPTPEYEAEMAKLPQPKGFTPIEASPVETAQPKGFGKPQDLFAKPTEETKIVYGAIDKEIKLLEPKIPLRRRNELFEQARIEGTALMKKRMGVTDYTTLTKPIYRNLLKAEAERQSTPIEPAPVVSKDIKEMTREEYSQHIEDSELPAKMFLTYEELHKPATHIMPSGEVMAGTEHKYSQSKLVEGQKADITPKMETEIQGQTKMFGKPDIFDKLEFNPEQPKAGQLTPEQLQQQISDVNIGREGMPSIKSEAEIRYAPGTGINLETLDLPPDIKHTIYKLTQQYQPQFEDARNRKTWEEINKEAEGLGFDANQLLERQKGEAYNAAKLKATKDIQNNTALEAKRIADEAVKLALDAKLTTEQQAEVLAIANLKMKKAAAVLAQAGGAYSEAGRALNILRQVTSATKAQKNWNAILDALGGREMTLEMFKRISGMDTADTPQVAKFIREVQKARTADMVLEAWRNAILSGTKTLVTNPLSNAITFATNPIETGIAAVLEKGRSVITGKKPQVYFREVPAEIVGAINGIWNGARVFLNTMKTEIPTFGETKIETAIMQTNIPGKLGRIIRTPQTILMAQDDAMKAVIYDSTMKTLATRFAIRKGLKGKKEIVDFVGNLLTNPQGKNKRLFDLFDKRARAEADYRTYNKALGKIGQILMRLRDQEFPKGSGIKPLYYVMPFMRTPTNIVKYGLERTPVNFARLGYKNYKGEIPSAHLSEEFAKPILGTIMFLWGWLMYEYGYMTGDAPKDKNDRATWYNAGKKPYSFYIPWLNRYISYQRIEPLGSIFGMIADFFEITHRGIANTKEAFTKILLSITRNWTNKTFIMGATNAINAYTNPERYGDRFVDGLTSSLVPNIISSFNPDPYYREKQTFLDSIKAKVPVLSETLPPKRDILGEPAKRGEDKGMALFNQILPFGVTKPSDDPVRKELLRLNDSIGFSVGMPNKYFRRGKEKIDISADVYDAYSKESGEVAYRLVNRIVKSKGYEKMDDENKASLIRKQFDIARDAIRPKYIRQLK